MNFNIMDMVGNTPIYKLYDGKNNNTILVKMEGFEPSGSIKDRVFKFALRTYEESGEIHKGMTLNIASSGNAAISLATLAIPNGYKVNAYMPSSTSQERRDILNLLGVKCVYVENGMQNAINKAKEDAANDANAYYVDQFFDDRLYLAHVDTVKEVVEQLKNQFNVTKLDAFVSGVGTGVTLKGFSTELRKVYPDIKILAFEPNAARALSKKEFKPHSFEGVGPNFETNNFATTKVDEIMALDKEPVFDFVLDLIAKYGLHVGITSACNIYAAFNCGLKDSTILCVSYDNYDKYIKVLTDYKKSKEGVNEQ